MKDQQRGRRYTDAANSSRIDELSENFSEFAKALDENTRQLYDLIEQMKKANEAGLQDILKSHRDSNGFSAVSVKFGKILIGIAAVGGAIAAIAGFGASFIINMMQGK